MLDVINTTSGMETFSPNITVIGVGGGGNSAVYRMHKEGLSGVNFIVANTDQRALSNRKPLKAIQLGEQLVRGRGAGSKPEIGEQAAFESHEAIREALNGTDMLFITAGMGGGTGTGASPIIAGISKELGILTVAVITTPFNFEGSKKSKLAKIAIDKIREISDAVIVISNQQLLDCVGKSLNMLDAFKKVDEVVSKAIYGVTNLIKTPGLINVDFNDVKTVMQVPGYAVMGIGEADGHNRVIEATKQAISNSLIEGVSIHGAKAVLINVMGNQEITLDDISEAGDLIYNMVDENANIVFGTSINDTINEKVIVTVFATGIS